MSLRAARPSGEPSIASPIVPTALAAPWPARPRADELGGADGVLGIVGERDRGVANRRVGRGDLAGPAAVEGGQRDVAAALGERREVEQQRRDVLGVEHREPQRLVALEHQVAGEVAQAGQARADGLRGREAVEVALARLLGELADEAAGPHGAVAQRHGGRAAEAVGEATPVARELAAGRVQLAQGAMLRGIQAGLAQRYRPGSHNGSSPALAARERMKSRSESRLR